MGEVSRSAVVVLSVGGCMCVCVSGVQSKAHTYTSLALFLIFQQPPFSPNPTSQLNTTKKQQPTKKNRYIAPESRTAYVDALFEALFVMPDKGTEIVAADVLVRWCFSFSFIVCLGMGWGLGRSIALPATAVGPLSLTLNPSPLSHQPTTNKLQTKLNHYRCKTAGGSRSRRR